MDYTKIKQLAVRIFNSKGAAIGSGTLFVPNKVTEYAYIFTAAHVAINGITEKRIKFKMLVNEEEVEFEINDENCIKCHDRFDKDVEPKEYDIAVIKINKKEWMKELPTLTIGTPKENTKIHGQGFPKKAYESKLIFAMLPLNGVIGTCSEKYFRFQLNILNDLGANHDEDLKGYSGCGIYEECDEKSELVLMGIFSYGQGCQATQKIANSFSSVLLRDICKKYGWEEPEEANQIPRSFEKYVDDAISIIENEKIQEQVEIIMNELIKMEIGPHKLIDSEDDMHQIPKCNNGNRKKCRACWIARLQLISILIILDVDICDLKKPEIKINDEIKIPIEFFCSEGNKGQSQMKQVIRSIWDSGYAWRNKFRDNAILVWASLGNQTHKRFDRTSFNNVIVDICKEPISKMKKYDAMYGDGKVNNLSIIHIDDLMTAIDIEDERNIKNKLLEVLENVIR